MDQRTLENLNRSNPLTIALPSRLIKMFFWGSEVGQGRSNEADGNSHRTVHRERCLVHEGIPHLVLINTIH